MIDLVRAILSVWRGHAERMAAPGRFRVWRDAEGFHVSVSLRHE